MSTDDSDDTTTAPTARERRAAVREKAEQVHVKQSRARVARRAAIVVVSVAVVAVIAVVITWTVSSSMNQPQLSPANVTADGFVVSDVSGAVVQGTSAEDADSAAVTPTPTPAEEGPQPTPTEQPVVDIRVYVDYLSTGAREWQLANAPQLTSWVTEGAVTLTYYPVAMLTSKSNGTKYSLRAASAAACVATHSPETFFAFNNDLLSRQPAVDDDGLSNTELADLAIATGAESPKIVRSCIESASFAPWAKGATERAVEGIPDTDDIALTGTPMILVNGDPYIGALDDSAEFSQFVLTSASDAFYEEAPTPTPTPSETAAP